MFADQITGLVAGEAIATAAMPLYIKTSDGKLYLTDGSAADELAEFIGLSARGAEAGDPLTVYGAGSRWRYGSGLSPGAKLYVSATAGELADAASTGGTTPVGFVINSTDIMITTSNGI
jgi:hypothetical protein